MDSLPREILPEITSLTAPCMIPRPAEDVATIARMVRALDTMTHDQACDVLTATLNQPTAAAETLDAIIDRFPHLITAETLPAICDRLKDVRSKYFYGDTDSLYLKKNIRKGDRLSLGEALFHFHMTIVPESWSRMKNNKFTIDNRRRMSDVIRCLDVPAGTENDAREVLYILGDVAQYQRFEYAITREASRKFFDARK